MFSLPAGVITDRARLRPLTRDSEATVTLRMAVRARQDLVAARVAMANQLRAHLQTTFPGAIGLFGHGFNPHYFVNPEILWASEETLPYEEGCLSIPEQFADVERPARCRVKWLDEQGAAHDEVFEGLLATCIQHEMDHLEGVVFIDHLSRLKRDMILKKLGKARKAAA